jgi:hypothetical protein
MDRLQRTNFLHHLTGKVFLSQYQAIAALDPNVLEGDLARDRPAGLRSVRGRRGARLA